MEVMFFHGLESGPHGRKYQALKSSFPQIVSPDFRGMDTIEERVAHAVELTEGKTGLLIVGSSFGGLCAAMLADRHPERVARLLLCAPALHRAEAEGLVVEVDVVIVHGAQDAVVPLEASQAWAKDRSNVLVLGVQDGHRLELSRDFIVKLAQSTSDP